VTTFRTYLQPTPSSALAEVERELVVERTKAGLASARARGRNGGRPFKTSTAELRLAQAAMGKPGTRIGGPCTALPYA
jgi:DNA invertase Pin-like site-specific DNA recombinase